MGGLLNVLEIFCGIHFYLYFCYRFVSQIVNSREKSKMAEKILPSENGQCLAIIFVYAMSVKGLRCIVFELLFRFFFLHFLIHAISEAI